MGQTTRLLGRIAFPQVCTRSRAAHNPAVARLPFVDWARGFAVVAMVLWHTGDAWIAPAARTGQGWLFLRFIGGLAAPLFLFLAGAGAALAVRAANDEATRRRVLLGGLGRGLEVVIVGYLLRFQTWMIDAGALQHPGHARAYLPIALGYACLYWSAGQFGRATRRTAYGLGIGTASLIAGLVQVESLAAGRLAKLLQVDVLQAIGASLILLALGQHLFRLLERPLLAIVVAIVVAMGTPAMSTILPGPLPNALAAYFGKFEVPSSTTPPALFPLFPWFAYACFGAALGHGLRTAKDREAFLVACAVVAALVAIVTSEAHPFIHTLFATQAWSVQLARAAYRIGIGMVVLLGGWIWTSLPVKRPPGRVLLDFGKTSLRVYWAHMLFAYGLLGTPLHKKLGFVGWAAWLCPLFVAMWGLSQLGRGATRQAAHKT
jgi:uncharacterized membrane protein